jgi:poly(3-hydroxybutyrate) depolymerase
LPAVQVDTAPAGRPAPIALVFALEDRIMPAGGGEVYTKDGVGVGGTVLSGEATVAFWVKRNRAGEPRVTTLRPGRDVHVRDYPAQPGGAPVRSVEIEGWRHKWPRWNPDDSRPDLYFDAADLVWSFFADCTRPGLGASGAVETSTSRVRLLNEDGDHELVFPRKC